MSQNKHFAVYSFPLMATFLFCGWASAQNYRPAYQRLVQATPAPVIQAQSAAIRPAKPLNPPAKAAKPSPAVPAVAPSLLSAPSEPAKITLASGKLTVEANNSSLSQILQQIAKAGGMKIDGLRTGGNADPRVFGSYGPGAPRDVLSDLLNGTSYNVLMMGNTAAGIPREMALSLRGAGVPNPAPRPSAAAQDSENQDDAQPAADATDTGDTDTDEVQSNGSAAEPENNLVPPAGVHENEPITPPPGAPGAQQKVKTPQEILQELQNMRMQQQQQQPQ